MLFVHEVHALIGEKEFDFEDALREGAARFEGKDSRLLWYLSSTHGSGDAYHVVTVTAVRDGAAWERMAERLRYGDLAEWSTQLASMRYHAYSSLLVSLEGSPLAGVDLDEIAVGLVEHGGDMFREDTLEGPGIKSAVAATAADGLDGVLAVEAAFEPAMGGDDNVKILYRVAAQQRWEPALAVDNGWQDWSGSLTQTLPEGARGSSRFLRSASWSPRA